MESRQRDQLIAYAWSKPVSRGRGACRAYCLPNLLLLLLIVLFAVVTVQIALFHYYGAGSVSDQAIAAHPYMLHGPGMLSRVYATPPPRVNLQQLLSRNVPSMLSNYRRLLVEINALQVNELLARESRSLVLDDATNNDTTNSTRTSPLPPCPDSPKTLRE